MIQSNSKAEIATARQQAAIMADFERIVNGLPDRLASSMPGHRREQVRAQADQAVSAAIEKLRDRLGADAIEKVARQGEESDDDDSDRSGSDS